MLLSSNHELLRFRDEVTQICRPLFDNTAISYFEYARYFKDGRFFELNTNADITLRYVNEKCYPDAAEIGLNTTPFIFMTQALPLPRATRGVEEKYRNNIKIFEAENVRHRVYSNFSEKDYFDVCGFGTNIEDSLAVELFCNNFDFLDRFRRYFIIEADKLIQEQTLHCIQLPITRPEIVIDEQQILNDRKLTTIQDVPLKQSCIISGVKLSPREYSTLEHLAHGKSAKEIARELSISEKTVRTYIERLKQKLNCYSKSQIIEFFWQSQ